MPDWVVRLIFLSQRGARNEVMSLYPKVDFGNDFTHNWWKLMWHLYTRCRHRPCGGAGCRKGHGPVGLRPTHGLRLPAGCYLPFQTTSWPVHLPPPLPTSPRPSVPHPHGSLTPPGTLGDFTTSLGSLPQSLTTLLGKFFSLPQVAEKCYWVWAAERRGYRVTRGLCLQSFSSMKYFLGKGNVHHMVSQKLF